MPLPAVLVNRTDGGLGRKASNADGISGIIIGVNAAYGMLTQNAKFTTLAEAEAFGITEAKDRTARVLVWHHLREYFRFSQSPINVRLFVQPAIGGAVTGPITYSDILSPAGTHAPGLLAFGGGEIRQLAVAMNPDMVTYQPTATSSGGLDSNVAAGIAQGQALAVAADADNRPILVVMEGRSFSGTLSALADLRALNADRVAVYLGHDPQIRGLDVLYGQSAMVGTLLGVISRSAVHENVGWVAKNDLSSQAQGFYLDAMLSGGHLVSALAGSLDGAHDKGYIFPRRFVGRPGVYLNDDPTAVASTSDFSQVRYCRTVDKAKRGVYAAYLPFVNSPIYLAPDGTIAPGDVTNLENVAEGVLRDMKAAGEISAFDVFIDPAQPVLSTNTINVRLAVVPVGCASRIVAQIGFTTSIA
jgi:hypothetical protein